ncbi:hypothetical protein SLS62_010567 [Diatrype stigma]|uniref:Box C/D snoRNA protein 1 n=1 Tax=Diatrype stigma TaxID=117547 RepID=A0AAN9UH93_9PEZI
MADPLLTSLCAICRVQTPKYKCPRCGTRTCSLTCIKKHKNWSSCNGERDPTVYVPVSKLRTDAGIDHDYNFLTKIERSVEIAEKILRDERDILPHEDTQQHNNKRARLHKGKSRGKVTLNENSRRWDRNSLQRMQRLGIHVSCLPIGMSRSKENKSSYNKRTNSINWQVEWVVLDSSNSTENDKTPVRTRIMHKLLDETPLYVGFANSVDYYRYQQMNNEQRVEERKTKKKQQQVTCDGSGTNREISFGQNVTSTAWNIQPSCIQNYVTTAWARPETSSLSDEIDPADEKRKDNYQFFYQKPTRRLKDPEKLVPLKPTDTLANILPGLDVVEFPTLCALPAGSRLPDGYAIEKRPRPQAKTAPKKRKSSALVEYGSDEEDGASGAEEETEDGEILDQEMLEDDTTSSSGSDLDMDTE